MLFLPILCFAIARAAASRGARCTRAGIRRSRQSNRPRGRATGVIPNGVRNRPWGEHRSVSGGAGNGEVDGFAVRGCLLPADQRFPLPRTAAPRRNSLLASGKNRRGERGQYWVPLILGMREYGRRSDGTLWAANARGVRPPLQSSKEKIFIGCDRRHWQLAKDPAIMG